MFFMPHSPIFYPSCSVNLQSSMRQLITVFISKKLLNTTMYSDVGSRHPSSFPRLSLVLSHSCRTSSGTVLPWPLLFLYTFFNPAILMAAFLQNINKLQGIVEFLKYSRNKQIHVTLFTLYNHIFNVMIKFV